jgi:hypothetical protein
MGLAEVTAASGAEVSAGNPLLPGAGTVPGGFAGVMVDLFLDGKLMPQLMDTEVWKEIRSRLRDPESGRVMAHLGPAAAADGALVVQTVVALNAMAKAFGGEGSEGGFKSGGFGGLGV